jgi:hypothetical protein
MLHPKLAAPNITGIPTQNVTHVGCMGGRGGGALANETHCAVREDSFPFTGNRIGPETGCDFYYNLCVLVAP